MLVTTTTFDAHATTCTITALGVVTVTACDIANGYKLLGNACKLITSGCSELECVDCPDNCEECDDSETCTTCYDEYYVDSDDACSACIDNCKVCENGEECKTCGEDYELDATK
jgi:membrane carboxypeptidase/penicillin-binding protein